MQIVKALVAATLVFGTSAAALAALPGGGGPLPSVRADIRQIAKQQGYQLGKGSKLVISPVHITLPLGGSATVTASIYEKSTFSGGPKPLKKAKLMLEGSGRFKVEQVMEGPVVSGKFQRIDR